MPQNSRTRNKNHRPAARPGHLTPSALVAARRAKRQAVEVDQKELEAVDDKQLHTHRSDRRKSF